MPAILSRSSTSFHETQSSAPAAEHTAAYVAALTEQLVEMCRMHRLDVLSYLLEMAQLEAEQMVQEFRLQRAAGDEV